MTLAVPTPLLSQPITRPPTQAGPAAEAEPPAPAPGQAGPTAEAEPLAPAQAGPAAEAEYPAPRPGEAAAVDSALQPASSRPEPRPGNPPSQQTPGQPAADETDPTPDAAPAPPDADVRPGPEPPPPDAALLPAPRPGDAAAIDSALPQPAPSRPEPRPDSPPAPAQQTPAQPATEETDPTPETAAAPPEADILPAPEPPPPDAPPLHQTLRESDFDHAACRLGLRLLGVEAAKAAPVADPDNRDCGIDRPVEVRALQPGLALDIPAVMRCDTARSLALWMREAVIPAARRLEGSPRITSVALGTSYACRGVVGGASTATVSEHALGNAVDIAGFGFDDGTRLEIAPRGDRGGIEMAFQNAVQAAACLYFATVLGPGSNAAHDDHLHLDIKARDSGFRLCQ
ncbi:extensin-like domain-containing protein [Paracoccus solventivorans]|uniref:extensin-like domain-containing protein n=1 Tax=Paracoccus solventivorans TaxID=53463 RepID=UPI001F254FBE|nr:extensin family protein [Paracoccus solventivorans]